jgi:hypothetical protein
LSFAHFPLARLDGDELATAAAFRTGVESLGPTFSVFCAELHAALADHRLADAIFVARDGHFLKACAEAWWRARNEPHAGARYIRMSRVSVRLAALHAADDIRREADSVRDVFAGAIASRELCAFLGLGAHHDQLIGPRTIAVDAAAEILAGERSDAILALAAAARRALSEQLNTTGPGVFVDVGWKGSTGRLLDCAFPDRPRRQWLFFGRWSETGPAGLRAGDRGLVADQQADGRFAARSARDLYALVEAVCSEATEPTTSHVDAAPPPAAAAADGRAGAGAVAADRAAPIVAALRAGILASLELAARTSIGGGATQTGRWREFAQRRLFRLAHFPDAPVLLWAPRIVVKETHSTQWSVPLCGGPAVNPLRHPLAWIDGFSCPWKATWAYRTAGRAGWLFWLAAGLLIHRGSGRVERVVKRCLARIGNGERRS